MKSLSGKKVLFFSPHFFGFEKEITAELIRSGAEVDFLPDRPFQSSLMKGITRVKRELILWYADQFYWKALKLLGCSNYDYILVVQGEGLSPKFLSNLRITYPNAKFILYMWDSFENKKSLLKNIEHFDSCFIFDPVDAKKYGLHFRPLFYSGGLNKSDDAKYKYDISFVGTAHSDRYSITSQIEANLPPSMTIYKYLYLQAPWMFWIHKIGNNAFKGARFDEFKFTPINKSEVQHIFSSSRSVLDIEHPNQNGLTMRTFEALGNQKKLITTNTNILDYDFYNSNNIFVLDRKKAPVISAQFFTEPYIQLSDELNYKYSITGWVEEVLRF